MELQVSPDVDAALCYGLLFFIGFLVGCSRVRERLGTSGLKRLSTWPLVFAYTLWPVALFWLLDRAGAIHDTSLLAVLLVGFGYQQILTGSWSGFESPPAASKLWQPFLAWADRIQSQFSNRTRRRVLKFREKIAKEAAEDGKKLDSLRTLAKAATADQKTLEEKLQETRDRQKDLGEKTAHKVEARLLFDDLRTSIPEEYEDRLYEAKLISWSYYWGVVKEGWSFLVAAGTATLLVSGLIVLVFWLGTASVRADFYTWRLYKNGTTSADRLRAQETLIDYLQGDGELAEATVTKIGEALTYQPLTTEDAEQLLRVMLIAFGTEDLSPLAFKDILLDALRAHHPDVRGRVHRILLFLYRECTGNELPAEHESLRRWQPSEGDSILDVEVRIRDWEEVLQDGCFQAS